MLHRHLAINFVVVLRNGWNFFIDYLQQIWNRINACDEALKNHLIQLSIFEKAVPIPLTTVCMFWNATEQAARTSLELMQKERLAFVYCKNGRYSELLFLYYLFANVFCDSS